MVSALDSVADNSSAEKCCGDPSSTPIKRKYPDQGNDSKNVRGSVSALQRQLQVLLHRIRNAEALAGRASGCVKLVAVTKTFPAELIADAHREGLRDFAESYVQEALPKLEALSGFEIVWHFIGPIQSNKTRMIATHFDWVHSIDRIKIAKRLNEQRPEGRPPLNVCIQVNVSGEQTKGGASLAELPELALGLSSLERLRLRGLMAIPAPGQPMDAQRRAFRAVREALVHLPADARDTLSMGMSDDLEAAILEGATMVRVGSALFGSRQTG